MTELERAAVVALEALALPSMKTQAMLIQRDEAIDALRGALQLADEPAGYTAADEPVAWAVQGSTQMIRGEFAELDAKSNARRIGGTCFAYPLYTTPHPRQWVGLTDEMVHKAMIAINTASYGEIQPTFEEMKAAIEAAHSIEEGA